MTKWKCENCNRSCFLETTSPLNPSNCPYQGSDRACWFGIKNETGEENATCSKMETVADPVNHPSHYTSGKFETIEVIEDWGLDFCLGNAVKYISRAGKKDPTKEVEDLNKAVWYINRRVKQLEGKE